jgi:hypothetical protein
MNTQFITKNARKHGKSIGWSTIILAIIGLLAQAISQHNSSSDNHDAIWKEIKSAEARISTLEQQQQYDKGYQAGKSQK